jgi:hypothetical protein
MNKNIKYRCASLIVLVIVLAPINPLMSPGQLIRADPSSYLEAKDGTNSAFTTVQNLQSVDNDTKIMGAYIPDTLRLEDMNGMDQRLAISKFLEQGFGEYYFIMDNFMDLEEVQSTERLLDTADNTKLKIVIILLPPSEGGPRTSYDWKGWINYFNDLKTRHPSSFSGFTIDDFNWISTRNDTKFWRNIDFMLYSNLTDALKAKRSDVKFCPVIYFEGLQIDVVASEYGPYIDAVILVSASYYNVSNLEASLYMYDLTFQGKPTRYIVYPTITYNYTRQGYDPPSDRLVMATLSIATRMVDGIIIWHKIDGPIVQDYLRNRENPKYFHSLHMMEQQQIAYEKSKVLCANCVY